MDNENTASILKKDAINASSPKIESESKHTKVFVLPPELHKGLFVKNETPKTNTTTMAETSSSKNNKKATKNKRESKAKEENSKSVTLSVDCPKRTTNRQSKTRVGFKNSKSCKSYKNNLSGLKNTEQNHEQNTVSENNETVGTSTSVETVTMQKKSNRSRKAKIKENQPSDFCNLQKSPDTILNKNQEKRTEINHEMNDYFINELSVKPVDSSSREKCTTGTSDKTEEMCTEDNHGLQDYTIDEATNLIRENNSSIIETIVSSCEKKMCDGAIKLVNAKTEGINQVLQDPQIEISQNNADQKILSGEISSVLEFNYENGVNVLSLDLNHLSNEEDYTIIKEETYIVEEIIEIVESDEEKILKDINTFEESNIHAEKVLASDNINLPNPVNDPVNIKSEPISKTFSVDFQPIVEQKRSNAMRVYVNKRRSVNQTSSNEIQQQRSVPQIIDHCIKDSLIDKSLKEISLDENILITISKTGTFTVNESQEIEDLQEVQKQLNSEIDCDYDENNLPNNTSIDIPVNTCEKLDSEVNWYFGQDNFMNTSSIQKFHSDNESRFDDNSLTNIAGIQMANSNQCQEMKYSNIQQQCNSEIDCNFDKHSLEKRDSTLPIETSIENSKEKLKPSRQICEKCNLEVECNTDQIICDTTKTETPELNSFNELTYDKLVSVLQNDCVQKTDSENKILSPIAKLIESSQNRTENIEKIQSIDNTKKSKDTNKKFKNQTVDIEIKTNNTRSPRKSSDAKKDVKTVKLKNEQTEIDIESTKNSEYGGLLKCSGNKNANNDIKQVTAVSIEPKNYCNNYCNNNELGKRKDCWENEHNSSIKSLCQLRNQIKVIPQDSENFNKLKDNIEEESLHFRNRDKNDFQVSNRTHSVSLNVETNSTEKLSRSTKNVSQKPQSTDNYLGNSDRISTLRRRSAVLENEIAFQAALENSNKIQSKDSLGSVTVEHEESDTNKKSSNESTALKDIIDDYGSTITENFDPIINQKVQGIIAPKTNLDEKTNCSTTHFQKLDVLSEIATGSNLKREKIIVIKKIRKVRPSKSSQPKDELAVTTDLEKSANKVSDTGNIFSYDNVINNLTQMKIPKTAENAILSENSVEEKLNYSSIDSSYDPDTVEDNPLKVNSEKLILAKKGRRGKLAKSTSSKEIAAENTKDTNMTFSEDNVNKISKSKLLDRNTESQINNVVVLEESGVKIKIEKVSSVNRSRKGRSRSFFLKEIKAENIEDNFKVDKNSDELESVNGFNDGSDSNLHKASEWSSIDTSIANRPVENALKESSLKIKTEKLSLVKSRYGRCSKSMVLEDNTTNEKHKKDNEINIGTGFSEDNSPGDNILTNYAATSVKIAENTENITVLCDLDDQSKCNSTEALKVDDEIENFSYQIDSKIKSQKLSSAKKGKRGRRPKSSQLDISTKINIGSDCTTLFVENTARLQNDNAAQLKELNEDSYAKKPIDIEMKIDSPIYGCNLDNVADAKMVPVVDKVKGETENSTTRLHRRNSRNDEQESLASKKDNAQKTKRHSERSSKFNVKSIIMSNDNKTKNIDSINVRRVSGRIRKSNVNYHVPDEDVDVFDSERQVKKVSSEDDPKKRRGRPCKKNALKLDASTEENLKTSLQESRQKANDIDPPPANISNTSTRKRRTVKSTITEDIFEVETEQMAQIKSLHISDQSEVSDLSEVAINMNDFEDSHFDDKCAEKDFVEEPKRRRGRKQRISFKTYTTRRGRPITKKNSACNDEDYAPHHSYVPRPTKVNEKLQKIANMKIVKCGKCGKEVPKYQWYSHNLYSHNDMSWLEGTEKPDFENDSKLLMRVLTAAHKKKNKKGLVCESCREIKRSVVGFISHMTFCGKTEEEVESLMVICDQCGGKFKPSSMEYHERQHRLETKGKRKREEKVAEKIINIFEPRSKRKAAEKAVSRISEFTALVQDENFFSATKKLKLSSPHIKKFIQKPLAKKKISGLVIAKWKRELQNNQEASCSQLGCQFTCKSLEEMREHYSSCNFTVTENYVCKVCRFQTLFEDEIIKHAAEKHTSEEFDVNIAMSDAEASDSEDYTDIDEDSSNQGLDQDQKLVKKFFYKETFDVENKMFKFIFNNGACHTILNKTFLPGFEWALEFERKNFKFRLFNELPPNNFTLLEGEDAESYLPELDVSIPVRFVKNNGPSTEPVWKSWARFDANCVDDSPTFFVGGPVWAMAWAPTPSFLAFSIDLPQFLAISTHPTMDAEYSIGQSYFGKNIIQIWSVGKLNNRTASESDPKLSYAITHDGGTVWSLEWCPSGCYQNEQFPDLKDENDPDRLGLLAAGCSDGCVRIYSLLFPQDLVHTPSENQSRIYKTEPVVKLIVNSEIHDNKGVNWQVTKTCWSREVNHNVIVAGFSNGYVAFWNLLTKSPLLRYKIDNTTFIRPYKQFFAHHHAVTMVALVPQDNKRYLATAGLDKLYKFWDLEDISKPKNTYKKSYVTDGAWMNNWCCAILAHDNTLCIANNPIVCLPLRNYTYKYYNLLPSNSTTYGVATSDFGNSVATGNVAGELLILFPHQLVYFRDMEKTIPPKRNYSLVSTTELVDFKAEPASNLPVKKDKRVKSEPYRDPADFMPSTYKESKDRFGIQFSINTNLFQSKKLQKYDKKVTLTCEKLEQPPIEQYPLKSINKVAWNPNASSFLWLAAGYQSGFVRLISLNAAASTAESDKIFQAHINALKAQLANTTSEEEC